MIHRQKEAWKKFIEGRIAQEQGCEEEGLEAFELALEVDPDNEHFRDACATARGNLGRTLSRSEEDLLAQVEESYEHFSSRLPGEMHARVNGLKTILAKLEGRGIPLRNYTRGLHCA